MTNWDIGDGQHRLPATMAAVLLTGHGGPEMLEYRTDTPLPTPETDHVLIRVGAAGVNNTDINTRVGWYSKTVTTATSSDAASDVVDDGGWAGVPLSFPRIQGADVCGEIVAVGPGVSPDRIGQRVIAATMQSAQCDAPFTTVTLGSEMDGSFAQFIRTHAAETHAVRCEWTDVELASVPCASSTAENMLYRIGVAAGERVLVTGASGGVGSAAVQLAKLRGATVIAVCGADKADMVRSIGADDTVPRGADLVEALGHESVDVVVDLVAGDQWPSLLDVMRRGGRYITAGAIAGPVVELDVRTLYLKDLTLKGSTYQDPGTMERLIGYIETDRLRPFVSATYPLADIARAQNDFVAKRFVGKLVLIP